MDQRVGRRGSQKVYHTGLKERRRLYPQRELARTINLRNTPDITFVMDQSIEYGVNMSHKIDEVIAADEQAQKPENEVMEETEEGDE